MGAPVAPVEDPGELPPTDDPIEDTVGAVQELSIPPKGSSHAPKRIDRMAPVESLESLLQIAIARIARHEICIRTDPAGIAVLPSDLDQVCANSALRPLDILFLT
jgi:hypothetical protein